LKFKEARLGGLGTFDMLLSTSNRTTVPIFSFTIFFPGSKPKMPGLK